MTPQLPQPLIYGPRLTDLAKRRANQIGDLAPRAGRCAALPTLPFWLMNGPCIKVDLDATYMRTIQGTAACLALAVAIAFHPPLTDELLKPTAHDMIGSDESLTTCLPVPEG